MNNTPVPGSNPPGLTMRGFLRALVRVLVFLLLLAALVAGVLFGLPFINRELVAPVRENSARLDALEQSLEADRAALLERVDTLQTRLDALETARASSTGSQAVLQSDLDALRSELNLLSQSLARLDAVEGQLDSLSEWQSYASTQVMGMQNRFQDPAGDLSGLRREVAQIKALNLLTRAQVHLAQNNFGIARDDAAMARLVLVEMRTTAPETELARIDAWVARLDLALANLPGFPVIAAGDLELVVQQMTGALLPPSAQMAVIGTETPTPATWLTETSAALTGTPTALATFTPTPLRSSTATAIPKFTSTATPTP